MPRPACSSTTTWLIAPLTLLAGAALAMSPACASESDENAPRNLESRLQDLSQKYGAEEQTPREPARIRAQIANLEARRSKLLERYTPTHPGVLQIDRQLLILRQRLAEAEAAPAATDPPAP